MTALLAILIYLNCLSEGQTVTTCQVDQWENAHHSEVLAIQADTEKYDGILDQYTEDAENVIVIDETCF